MSGQQSYACELTRNKLIRLNKYVEDKNWKDNIQDVLTLIYTLVKNPRTQKSVSLLEYLSIVRANELYTTPTCIMFINDLISCIVNKKQVNFDTYNFILENIEKGLISKKDCTKLVDMDIKAKDGYVTLSHTEETATMLSVVGLQQYLKAAELLYSIPFLKIKS